MSLNECMNIVDMISEKGGCTSVKNILSIVMYTYPEVYKSVIDSEINGTQVKELL